MDHWGIVKADVGGKSGRISAVGKEELMLNHPWTLYWAVQKLLQEKDIS